MPENTSHSGFAPNFHALKRLDIAAIEQLEAIVTQRDRLQQWALIRLLPNMQRVVVGRFRKQVEADQQLRFLRRQLPDAEFVVIFDCD